MNKTSHIKHFLIKGLLIVILFSIHSLQAQENRFSISLEGGPNWSNFDGYSDDLDKDVHRIYTEKKYNVGVTLGMGFQYNLKKFFALKSGLMWQSKTGEAEVQYKNLLYQGPESKFTTLDYLKIPLVARLSFGKKMKFFLQAGGFAGFLIQAKTGTEDKTSFHLPNEYGYELGIGTLYNVSELLFIEFEIRNTKGITQVASGLISSGVTTNSTSFKLGLAYKFGFKKKEK